MACPISCTEMLQMCCNSDFVEAYRGSKLNPMGLGKRQEGFLYLRRRILLLTIDNGVFPL